MEGQVVNGEIKSKAGGRHGRPSDALLFPCVETLKTQRGGVDLFWTNYTHSLKDSHEDIDYSKKMKNLGSQLARVFPIECFGKISFIQVV